MRRLGASAASPERKRATLGARSPRDLIVLGIGGHLVGLLRGYGGGSPRIRSERSERLGGAWRGIATIGARARLGATMRPPISLCVCARMRVHTSVRENGLKPA